MNDSDQILSLSPSLLSNQEELITSQNVTATNTSNRPQMTNDDSNSQNSSVLPSTENVVNLDQILLFSAETNAHTLSLEPIQDS